MPAESRLTAVGLPPRPRRSWTGTSAIAIACSTGGTSALETLLLCLKGAVDAPILVVQHLPSGDFTADLAKRLEAKTGVPTSVLQDSPMRLKPGTVTLAMPGRHMAVRLSGIFAEAHATDGPPEHSVRPAADVLLRSVAAVYRSDGVAVVLTGAGSDGALGCVAVAAAGGAVFAQDPATCAAPSMPNAAIATGVVRRAAPLASLARLLRDSIARGTP